MKSPDWMKSASLKWEPPLETVRLESEPPGAEAKTSSGQSCRTPCALALADNKPVTVSFTLNGYQPDTEKIELISMGDGTSKLQPNPVLVQLTPAPPPPKPKKPVAHKKKTAAKPAPKRATSMPASASSPSRMAPQPQQGTSPWPTTSSPATR